MTEFKPSISFYFDKLRADRDHIRYSREDLFKIIGITSDGFDNFIKENDLETEKISCSEKLSQNIIKK